MATRTLGTSATTSLTSIFAATGSGTGKDIGEQGNGNFNNFSQADFATVQESIINDKTNALGKAYGALTKQGLLFVPNRGVLRIFPGDWVGVDSSGWPILVSAHAIATGPWTHS